MFAFFSRMHLYSSFVTDAQQGMRETSPQSSGGVHVEVASELRPEDPGTPNNTVHSDNETYGE